MIFGAVTGCYPPSPTVETRPAEYVLAFSWQPAFCETRPNKPECKSQHIGRFDADSFTLHGLWPQPRSNNYCGVSDDDKMWDRAGKWSRLPALGLSADTREMLQLVMPGYQSGLHRHEWIKHGTCYSGETAQHYYDDSLWLMQQLNMSALRKLFAENIGTQLDSRRIREAFDNSFGEGVAQRLRIKCIKDQNSGRRLISELTLALVGDIDAGADFSKLVLSAEPDKKTGCPAGIIDPVGLQ